MAADNIFWAAVYSRLAELLRESESSPAVSVRRTIITGQVVQNAVPQPPPEDFEPPAESEHGAEPLLGGATATAAATMVDLTPTTTRPPEPIPRQLPNAATETTTQSHSAEPHGQAPSTAHRTGTNFHDEASALLTPPPPPPLPLYETLMAQNITASLPYTVMASTPFPLTQPFLQSAAPSFSAVLIGTSSGSYGATSNAASISAGNLTLDFSRPLDHVLGYGPPGVAPVALVGLIVALCLIRIAGVFSVTERPVNQGHQESQQAPAADNEKTITVDTEPINSVDAEQVNAVDVDQVNIVEAKQVGAVDADQLTSVKTQELLTESWPERKQEDIALDPSEMEEYRKARKAGEGIVELLYKHREGSEDLFFTSQRLIQTIERSENQRAQVDTLTMENRTLKDQNATYKTKAQNLEEKLCNSKAATSKVRELEASINGLTAENKKLNGKLLHAGQEKAAGSKKHAKDTKYLKEAIAKLEKELQTKSDDAKTLAKEKVALKKELEMSRKDSQDKTALKQELELSRKDSQDKITLKQELELLKKDSQDKTDHVGNLNDTVDEQRKHIRQMENELALKTKAETVLTERIDRLKSQHALELSQRVDCLNSEHDAELDLKIAERWSQQDPELLDAENRRAKIEARILVLKDKAEILSVRNTNMNTQITQARNTRIWEEKQVQKAKMQRDAAETRLGEAVRKASIWSVPVVQVALIRAEIAGYAGEPNDGLVTTTAQAIDMGSDAVGEKPIVKLPGV